MLKHLKNTQKNTYGWKSQYFRKSFILILLIAFTPGLISGIGIYWFGVSEVEDSLKEMHESQIIQRAENINDQFDYLETSVSHWAFEPRFNSSLMDLNYVENFQDTRDIVRTLLVLQGSNPMIDKVELYVDSPTPVIFKPSYNVLEEEEHEFYQSILANHKNISWNRLYYSPNESEFEDPTPLVLTHSIPGNSNAPFGSIILILDRAKVADIFKALTPYDKGATFLLDEDNNVLVADNSTGEESFNQMVRERLLNEFDNVPAGSFTFEYSDETYSVSYGKMKRIDSEWTYVSAAPMSSITTPIVFISKIIILISLAGLLLALILSWFVSKKIYSPVAKLIKVLSAEDKWSNDEKKDEFLLIEQQFNELSKESKSLQNRLTTQLPQLRNSFLLQLIQGYLYHYTEQDLYNRMQNYGWELKEHSFVVIDIQVLGLHESKGALMKQDESLVAFTLTNIMEEASHQRFDQYNVINFYDLSTVVLIVYPSNKEMRAELHGFSEQITDILNRVLQTQVTVTISKPDEEIKRIPYLFEEVRQGKRYRNFEDENQIIDLQTMEPSKNLNYIHYPFEIEKEILQAIRIGHIDEAEKLIRDFIQELIEEGSKEINILPAITQLFSSIQHEILYSGIHPNEIFEGKNMFEEVTHLREPEQMVIWLRDEVITPFVQKVEGRVNIEMKSVVEQVCTYIQENFKEDVSLESCADDVKTNPYTLSKAFKKVIGVNFIDYLTGLRMDKAKELLLQTNMKINDIAEEVGYRHSYFNRIFKKQVGVTPSQYRKKLTNEQ
ncbi:AraC family transcriptional regulator [Salipaludibacillus neizhouensis]|uniref:AraC family transcriptional regulator n=1 Tax=Salipaludibacillus neizhouensis TaxID=885475 RepID=A0A3A9K5T6_9BACI|nr:AraC family transcriptional regulator [Salipaludibacillus neizhouensis]RKL66230.1 AraC family transcriptional regulator [Salipaludibacillus neizhouensis]